MESDRTFSFPKRTFQFLIRLSEVSVCREMWNVARGLVKSRSLFFFNNRENETFLKITFVFKTVYRLVIK